MLFAQHLLALVLVMFGASCADEMPVTARYTPADCPPAAAKPDTPMPEVDPVEAPPHETESEAEAEPADDSAGPVVEDGELVDLNLANAIRLATLPGVGPALAARIIAYREKRAFEKIEDLRRVRGIGPAKFAKLEHAITVGHQKRTP